LSKKGLSDVIKQANMSNYKNRLSERNVPGVI